MAQDEFPLLEEAVDRWAKRDVLPWTAFDALADELKARAFTAKRLWDQQALEQTLESLRQALTEGKTVREWQATSWRDLAIRFGTRGADASHYVDTVFRTNTQAAYAGGRYAEMFNADWMEAAPYWMYSAIHDGRTRPEHRALDGRVFLKSDPDARRYLPPISFNCRCQCIELTQEDVDDGGYKPTAGTDIQRIPLIDSRGKPLLDPGTKQPLFVGAPPKGWDADRVESLVPGVLRNQPARPQLVPPPSAPPTAAPPAAPVVSVPKRPVVPSAPTVPPIPSRLVLPHPSPATGPASTGKPLGTPVSRNVTKLPGVRRAEVDRVLKLIDSVHGDGILGRMGIKFGPGDGGFYRFAGTIKIGTAAKHWTVQLAHEVGHWLEYRGVQGWTGLSATTGPEMREVMAAINRSQAVASLRGRRRPSAYLLQPSELWARAYSQFIAEMTGDQQMLDHVALWKEGKAKGRDPDGLWDTLDFAPIKTEIVKMMQRLGWRT